MSRTRFHRTRLPAPDRKWYYFKQPPMIDAKNFDDITQAIADGRLDKIMDKHMRCMKETGREIWNL